MDTMDLDHDMDIDVDLVPDEPIVPEPDLVCLATSRPHITLIVPCRRVIVHQAKSTMVRSQTKRMPMPPPRSLFKVLR